MRGEIAMSSSSNWRLIKWLHSIASGLMLGTGLLLSMSFPAAGQTSDNSAALEEIIVTAERRPQTLEQAPAAVTYVSPATAKTLDIRDLATVQFVSPDMSFSSQVGYAQVFIRGIGANYANPGLETSVAIYQDDAYQTGGNTSILKTLDIANIQVLNGPQGTLYGRNASGGVILLDTANPTIKEETTLAAEFGRFGHEQVDVVVNQPVTADLNVRFAARFEHDDGFVHNEYDDQTLGGGTTYMLRGKADWTPAAVPGLDVLWMSEYDYSFVYQDYEHERLQSPLCLGCELGAVPPTGFYDVNQNGDYAFKKQSVLNVLHVTQEFDDYTFKSVTSQHYNVFNVPHGSDQDYTTLNLFQFVDYVPGRTYTEDLSLASKYQGPLNFIAGVNFIRDDRAFRSTFLGLTYAAVETGPYADSSPSNQSFVRTESASGFLQGTYQITSDLSFTAGGRFNYDRRVLDAQNNPVATLLFGTSEVDERVIFHSFTPSYTLQYATPVGNLYASDTHGFKAGGFNTPAFVKDPIIGPEKIHSDEVGIKSTWLDHRLQTTFDVFHYVVSGLQVSVTDVLAGGDVTENAASAKATGAEFSARFAATRNLTLGFGGDYLHARFESYENASLYCPSATGLVACVGNLSGTPLPHAPDGTAYITAEYGFVPFSGYKAAVAALAHWTDRFLFIAGAGGPLGLDQQGAYALVNLNAWIGPEDDRYRVGLYVDNATDKKYFDFATTAGPYGAYYQPAPPITFGVKLQYRFGQ
jgi:iron complex outermembrane recepter protein